MPTIKAAAIQLNSQPDISQSLKQARDISKRAHQKGARLICLPENFAFLDEDELIFSHATDIQKAVESEIPKWASEWGAYILAGGFPADAGNGKIYNRSAIWGPDGADLCRYHKIHLFDVDLANEESYQESRNVQAGEPKPIVYGNKELPMIGFSICYDVRFPELYRKLMEANAELITVPAAFTRPTGQAHWETLLRARAIENSCWVIAAAQTGRHGNTRKTYGHSLIINPWGEILADAGEKPGYIIADIDSDEVEKIRSKIPSVHNRKFK